MVWQKTKQNQKKKTHKVEDLEINPHSQSHFDKELKHTSEKKKDSLFNKWCWDNKKSECRRIILDASLSPYTKINSKQIKTFHV